MGMLLTMIQLQMITTVDRVTIDAHNQHGL